MKRIAAIGVLCLLAIAGCRTDMLPLEEGNPSSARKVLIAGERTAFKENVVKRIMEKLGTRDYFFRVTGLDGLEGRDRDRYGSILLVTSQQAGKIDPRVVSFLAEDPQNPRLIVFFTRGTEDPMPERSRPDIRVDTVTSASRDDRVETRADELAALVKARF